MPYLFASEEVQMKIGGSTHDGMDGSDFGGRDRDEDEQAAPAILGGRYCLINSLASIDRLRTCAQMLFPVHNIANRWRLDQGDNVPGFRV